MTFETTNFPGVFLIKPKIFGDNRGYFFESFNSNVFKSETGLSIEFIQHNQSKSAKGVLRGLHFQREPYAQAKLVRVLDGKVLDIAVDLREGSPTFGKWLSLILDSEEKNQLFIPRGFAHGFLVLSDFAEFFYCVDRPYAPGFDDGIRFDDPELNIDWQMDAGDLMLSDKDKELGSFADAMGKFKY